MLALLTGVNGFTGKFLSAHLKAEKPNSKIIGIDLDDRCSNNFVDTYFSIDQFTMFKNTLDGLPDECIFFHLGGLIGNKPLPELVNSNVYWTSKYLELASTFKNLKVFMNIGSSAEYGKQKVTTLVETLTTNPVTNYGISKDIQSKLVMSYGEIFNLPVIATRTFNLIGPGLTSNLVVGKIIQEFKDIKRGQKLNLEMGRTDSKRDFIDVRDAVKIYYQLAINYKSNDIYNVARGKSFEIAEVLHYGSQLFEIKPNLIKSYKTEPNQDVDFQFADVSKLHKQIGLFNYTPLVDSLKDMMNFRV
ncbi:MAG: GDP-mannose 4,6-dehydratase [Salinivirgaceae bacterium]